MNTENKEEKKNNDGMEDDLIHKIHAVQSEVKELVRTGKVAIGKGYDFFNELEVFKLLRPLLKTHKLAILISDDPSSELTMQQSGNQWVVKFLKKLEIVNVKSGDDVTTKEVINKADGFGGLSYKLIDESKSFSFWAIGNNTDPSKAKGAADTYAVKYVLSKFFMIPVINEDDPDYLQKQANEAADVKSLSEAEQTRVNNFLNKHNIPKKISSIQVQRIYDLFVEARGESREKQKEFLTEFDKIMNRYGETIPTSSSNFRTRLGLLKEGDFQSYWKFLEENK